MRRASSAGSRPLRQPLRIFPVRPGVWCAGGCGRRRQKTQASKHRSARGVRPATAGGRFTSSMNCSANATGWPSAPRCPTRVEAQLISIRINVTTPLPRLRRTLSHGGEREEYIFALSPCGRGWRASAGRGVLMKLRPSPYANFIVSSMCLTGPALVHIAGQTSDSPCFCHQSRPLPRSIGSQNDCSHPCRSEPNHRPCPN